MKKTLIALAVLGAAGVAHAQSNVTIYGAVDVGFIKESGRQLYMGENYNNRLGVRGSEDLGGGLKATFNLEQRFQLQDGTSDSINSGQLFDGAANVGLMGSFGHVRVGRMNQLSTETYRVLDPFQQYGIGGMIESDIRTARLSNTVRWDSPVYNGVKLGASYTLKASNTDYGGYSSGTKAGYALNATYTNGPLYLVANYDKPANGDEGDKHWNIGGSYAFGPAKVSAGYESTDAHGAGESQKGFVVGLTYAMGNGLIKAAYSQAKWDDSAHDKQSKYAIGYTHNLSKRTAVYVDYSRTKTTFVSTAGSDSVNAFAVGVTHKF